MEQCDLKDAIYLDVGGNKFKLNETFSKTRNRVSIRVEFDRWVDVEEADFQLFNIIPMRQKPLPKAEFTGSICVHKTREIDNHGMTWDAVETVCVVLPEEFLPYCGRQVEITAKVRDTQK